MIREVAGASEDTGPITRVVRNGQKASLTTAFGLFHAKN
jgi:hypothetical protein